MRTKFSPLFSAALALAAAVTLLSGSAHAQNTGPKNNPNGGGGPGPGPVINQAQPGRLTPEALADYLRQQNHRVQTLKGSDGRPILIVQIDQKDWKYEVQIQFLPDLSGFYMLSHFGKVGAQSSPAQLAELLKANQKFAPAYFSIWPDGRLCLEDLYGSNMTTAAFQTYLNGYLAKIQQSYSLWDSNRWPAGAAQN